MDTPGTKRTVKRIGILPIDGFALMSYASTVEPFRAANLLSGQPLYDVVTYGVAPEPIRSSGAASVTVDAILDDARSLDYFFVVAGGDPIAFSSRRVRGALARFARQRVTLGGVSGGPVILARAGVMAGYRMTVHWEHAAALAEISPQLLLERSLYVIDRDRITCAGGTAPLDLMHAIIGEHHGPGFSRRVSDWFMHTDIRPSAGPQRGGLVARVGSTNPGVLGAARLMEQNVARPVSLGYLAASAGLSERQLNRLFRVHLGRSTMRYYRDIRLEKARNLLRNSPLSVTEIALATGFANPAHFSERFRRRFGHPPTADR